MRILIDGVDGAGKTSVCEKLANKLGCNIVRLTHNGDRSFRAYLESMIPDNMVHDRTFMSEIIYPRYFGRESRLNLDNIEALFNLIKEYDAKVFILTASHEELLKRLEIRGDEFLDDFEKVKFIDLAYFEMSVKHNFVLIDTTNKSVDEIVEEIGGLI